MSVIKLQVWPMSQRHTATSASPTDNTVRVTAAGFVVAMLSWSVNLYAPFVLALNLQHTLGWTTLEASAPVTVHFLASAILLWGLDQVHRRLGLAETLCCGLIASSLGIIAWANATGALQACAAALVTGLGWSFAGSASIAAFIGARAQPWSLATALNGATVGGLISTPALVFLIDAWGRNWTAILIAALVLFLATPLLLPLRGKAGLPQNAAPAGYSALIANVRYRWLGLAFAVLVFGQIGATSHLLMRMAQVFDAQGAAYLMTLVLTCGMAGRWLTAWALSRVDCRLAAALSFLVQAGAIVIMGTAEAPAALFAACAIYGLTVGNSILLLPVIAQAEFPLERGKVVASVSSSNQLALSLAPIAVALVFEATRGYWIPFVLLALIQAGGLSVMVWIWATRSDRAPSCLVT
jgi:Major Facilitator Superfamily